MSDPRPEQRWTQDGLDFKRIVGEKTVWVRRGMVWVQVYPVNLLHQEPKELPANVRPFPKRSA